MAYTPTDDEVRTAYVQADWLAEEDRGQMFDRWLAEHDRKVQEAERARRLRPGTVRRR